MLYRRTSFFLCKETIPFELVLTVRPYIEDFTLISSIDPPLKLRSLGVIYGIQEHSQELKGTFELLVLLTHTRVLVLTYRRGRDSYCDRSERVRESVMNSLIC